MLHIRNVSFNFKIRFSASNYPRNDTLYAFIKCCLTYVYDGNNQTGPFKATKGAGSTSRKKYPSFFL